MGELSCRLNGFNVSFDFHGKLIKFNSARITQKQHNWFRYLGLTILNDSKNICVFSASEKIVYFGNPILLPNSIKSKGFEGWDLSRVKYLDYALSRKSFNDVKSIESIDTKSCISMQGFLSYTYFSKLDLSKWDTSLVRSFRGFLRKNYCVEYVNLSCIDFSKCKDLREMFSWCEKLKIVDGSDWNFENVENVTGMFLGCAGLTEVDLSIGTRVSKAPRLLLRCDGMFAMCRDLKSVSLSGWDFRYCESAKEVFEGCVSLESVDFSGCIFGDNVPKNWFRNCRNLEYVNFNGSDLEGIVSDDWFSDSVRVIRYGEKKKSAYEIFG